MPQRAMPKEITLRFRATKKLKNRILSVAKRRGECGMSAVTREGLEKFLDAEELRLGLLAQPAAPAKH